jgi:hypothetical protein
MEKVRDRVTGKLRDPREGDVIRSADKLTVYRIENAGGTRRGVQRKVRGKAERKRLKRERMRARL